MVGQLDQPDVDNKEGLDEERLEDGYLTDPDEIVECLKSIEQEAKQQAPYTSDEEDGDEEESEASN